VPEFVDAVDDKSFTKSIYKVSIESKEGLLGGGDGG
jgi:hypothetical protein